VEVPEGSCLTQGVPPGSAEHKVWVASSKECKKAWRLLKRKYARHSRQARHSIIFKDTWRSLTRSKKSLAPEPALFLEHQRSVMGSQPGSEAARATLIPLDLSCFPPFTEAEARAAFDKLETGKMPGVDKVPAELATAFPGMFARDNSQAHCRARNRCLTRRVEGRAGTCPGQSKGAQGG